VTAGSSSSRAEDDGNASGAGAAVAIEYGTIINQGSICLIALDWMMNAISPSTQPKRRRRRRRLLCHAISIYWSYLA